MAKIITFKNNLEYYLRLYDSRIAENDLLGAIDACRSAMTHANTRIQRDAICVLLGQIYFDMQLYNLSCDQYFLAVHIPSSRAGAYLGIARNLIMINKLTLAIEYLDRVLEWDYMDKYTQDVLYWNNIIKQKLQETKSLTPAQRLKNNIYNLFKLNQFTQINDYLDELSHIYPYDAEFAILNAKNKMHLQDYNTARNILFQTLSHTPNYPPALLLLARLCVILQDHNTAREHLHTLSQLPQLNNDTILSMGGIYFQLGDYHSAIQLFQQILSRKPYRPKLLLFTAISYYNIQDYQNALYYIGQARWIDYNNPVLKQFYHLFNSANQHSNLPLTDSLPLEIIQQKIQKLIEITQADQFTKYFYNDDNIRDDIELCMTLPSTPVTSTLALHITGLKNKKATHMVHKILLSSQYSLFSKFHITKHAIVSGNYKYIHINSNYIFRSFKSKIPRKYKQNDKLYHAIANAQAYVQCYAHKVDINTQLHYISDSIIHHPQISLDESTITCLFFYEYQSILQDVCRYFQVPIHSVQSVLTQLGVH